MAAVLIDGKQLAQTMQAEIATEVAAFAEKHRIRPGLAAVLVGDNDASERYVRNKRRDCEKVGITSWLHKLPADTTQTQLLDLAHQLNTDPAVHGILVQLPLPKQIDEATIIKAVAPIKDIDGFGPENLGSNIVGKPLALILMQKASGANATVTVCHSRSRNLAEITRSADIVVVAIGQARFLKADMIRPGAVVIDVGMNRGTDGKLCGDVDFDAVKEVASAITPVPGGVGPMTITMLLHNTLAAARLQVMDRS